jgi:glycosyltransferase involved in cell wall biosynthesis
MRILVVANNFPVTERDFAASFALPFIRELRRRGHAVTIVTMQRDTPWKDPADSNIIRIEASGTKRPGGEFAWLNPLMPLMLIRLDRRAKKQLRELLENTKFDIGLALWAEPSGRWLAWVKKRFNLPFMVWCLGADIWTAGRIPILKQIIRSTLRQASGLFADGFALSDEVRRLSGRDCSFLPTSRTLPHPVDSAVNPDQRKLFVFIGRMEPVKGVDVLIKAFAAADIKDARLVLFGEGSCKKEYQAIAERCRPGDSIQFKGIADIECAAAYLSAAHCCVIPSRQESIPVILSDALQCRCPILVTRVGDMGAIIDRFRVGLVVPPDDVGALREALKDISGKSWDEYRANCELALPFFSLPEAVSRFLSAAQQAIQSSPGR